MLENDRADDTATFIKLKSSDDVTFKVSVKVAKMSRTLSHMIEDMHIDGDSDEAIPIANITGDILKKVLEYCECYVGIWRFDVVAKMEKGRTLKPWEKEFCSGGQDEVAEILLAANYLDIGPLLEMTCQYVANIIVGKTPDEIRAVFNIENDFTPEEEEGHRKETVWCQDIIEKERLS